MSWSAGQQLRLLFTSAIDLLVSHVVNQVFFELVSWSNDFSARRKTTKLALVS